MGLGVEDFLEFGGYIFLTDFHGLVLGDGEGFDDAVFFAWSTHAAFSSSSDEDDDGGEEGEMEDEDKDW